MLDSWLDFQDGLFAGRLVWMMLTYDGREMDKSSMDKEKTSFRTCPGDMVGNDE